MKVRDILNKDTFVYVLDFYKLKEDEVPNKIYKCKVNLKYEEWDRSMWGEETPIKHIQGTIHSSKNFSNGADFQVIRLCNDARESTPEHTGMHGQDHLFDDEFEEVLNSTHIDVYHYRVFAEKEDAEAYIRELCRKKIEEYTKLISKYYNIIDKLEKIKIINYSE